MPHLIDMLADWASSSAKEAAGLTLRTITAGAIDIKRAVVESGVVPPLVRILQAGTPTASTALRTLMHSRILLKCAHNLVMHV